MSFLGLHILTSARVAALKADGHAVASAAGSALMTAVTLAAQVGNPIGAAALKTASALEGTGTPGADKKAQVVAAIVPLIITEAAKGNLTAVAADAEQFAGLVVEEVVATMKQTPIVMLGEALLKALGF